MSKRGSLVSRQAQSKLLEAARPKLPLPNIMAEFTKSTNLRHLMVRRLFYVNAALFGGYLLMTGPHSHIYKKYLTLDANSSLPAVALGHLGHTNFW